MGNVIGPLEASKQARYVEWRTMREMRESLKYFPREPEFQVAVGKITETYKLFLKNYVGGVIK